MNDMESNVTKSENNNNEQVKTEEKEESSKVINASSFIMDINTLKAPLFMYNNHITEKDENGNIIEKIEEKTYSWIDSKNQSRKLHMYCKGRLPRQFESDTLYGLVGLFVRKHAPFPFNNETKQYEVNVSKLEFSWYELCEYMNIPSTGFYIKKLKTAIRILRETNYTSYENGVIYDKKNVKYLNSTERGINLLGDYMFKTSKKVEIVDKDQYSSEIDNNYVVFNDLILNNLRYEYFKYLNYEVFFSLLPSGIERGIYGYLEANRYDSDNKTLRYIKRSYEALRVGIPVDYDYPYEVKRRLKKPLNHLVEIGYLRDWKFGDDLKVDGKKEHCIYFCFNITAKEVKNILERKTVKAKQLIFDVTYDIEDEFGKDDVSKSEKPYLKMPLSPINEELINRGVDSVLANEVVIKKDKWTIIKYILWADKQAYEKKIKKGIGNILGFALWREEDLPIGTGYEDVIEFIEREKLNSEKDIVTKTENIKNLYKEYINLAMEEFKLSDEYEPIKELILSSQNARIDEIIKNHKKLGNDVSKYEKFKIEQDKSEYFNELLTKEVRLFKRLMSEQEFIQKQLSKK